MPLFEGLSYGTEKTAVIFDIGAAFTKCGFAGENSPRCIIRSEVKLQKTGNVVRVRDVESDQLYSTLVEFVHVLFFRHLLVNPKERRVVVVESILSPSVFRNTLAKVLFTHYEVPSVLFSPSHLVSLFSLGIPTALVLDSGYTETLVLPVYEGTPLLKAWQAIPIAAKAIHSGIATELLEHGKVSGGQQEASVISADLTEDVLEDIKVRCCFVTNFERGKSIYNAKLSKDSSDQMPKPPQDVDFPLDGSRILKLPGHIREHCAEVMFEEDNEEKSLARLILDSILMCPIDVRRPLSENIMITGGTSMMPGFKPRLVAELRDLIQKPKYREQLAITTFKFLKIPAKENYVAWLGGAILGDLEILANRSISRENYQQNGLIPDWPMTQEIEENEKSQIHTRK